MSTKLKTGDILVEKAHNLQLMVVGLNEDKTRVKFVDRAGKNYSISKTQLLTKLTEGKMEKSNMLNEGPWSQIKRGFQGANDIKRQNNANALFQNIQALYSQYKQYNKNGKSKYDDGTIDFSGKSWKNTGSPSPQTPAAAPTQGGNAPQPTPTPASPQQSGQQGTIPPPSSSQGREVVCPNCHKEFVI
jgi:hypothetical protein